MLNSTVAAPVTSGGDLITLLHGTTFCLSASSGDIRPAGAQGLFAGDARVISRWELRVDGESLLPMLTLSDEPARGKFILRRAPRRGETDSTLLVVRDRAVGDDLRETLIVENRGAGADAVTVTLAVDADFADVFAVKEGRAAGGGASVSVTSTGLVLRSAAMGAGVRVSATQHPHLTPGALSWRIVIPAGGRWCAEIVARPGTGSAPGAARTVTGDGAAASRDGGTGGAAVIRSDAHACDEVLACSARDLAALRIHDPAHPDRPFAAAGAPWFMTLFGRDSMLTAYMALPLDPSLALGTLQALAEVQGRRVDPATEEQPGRILHERRSGPDRVGELGGGRYYGAVDTTPLFVMLLAESWRWGASEAAIRDLLPAADTALEWITRYGDADGDGFVEYQRSTPRGLANQGWKDSPGSINHADGRLAQAPIALAEVQGYVYAAWLARAELADAFGAEQVARDCRARAAQLRASFDERFWVAARGWYAVALDGSKRQVTALTSNAAHCLWTGIAADSRAAALVGALAGESMDSGFGLRTLAAGMGAYNPMSYHNGSVWPHDNAIAVAGLLRYAQVPGAVRLAGRLATGVLDAAGAFGGRPPELYCGFGRREFGAPVPYPTSCSPQAWASAAPLLMLRAFLGLEPNVPQRRLTLRPRLPGALGEISITGLRLGGLRLDITARGEAVTVRGLPPGWTRD